MQNKKNWKQNKIRKSCTKIKKSKCRNFVLSFADKPIYEITADLVGFLKNYLSSDEVGRY